LPATDDELTDDERLCRAERIRRNGPISDWGWTPNPSDTGAWYVLQTTAEPPHLVGPFASQQAAYVWGNDTEARAEAANPRLAEVNGHQVSVADNETAGWQLVWLEDPSEPPELCEPWSPVQRAA
jgi:hypothetical protein